MIEIILNAAMYAVEAAGRDIADAHAVFSSMQEWYQFLAVAVAVSPVFYLVILLWCTNYKSMDAERLRYDQQRRIMTAHYNWMQRNGLKPSRIYWK